MAQLQPPPWPACHVRREHRIDQLPVGAGGGKGDPMSDFLNSIKDDLTDRRLLPLVIGVAVALLGAVAYAALRRRLGLPARAAVLDDAADPIGCICPRASP